MRRETKYCEEVDFLGGEVFKTSTRSMKQAYYKKLQEEMSKRKSKKDTSLTTKPKEDELLGGKQKEGPPKETDPDYDRNHPKYFMGDISEETKNLLQEEQARAKSIEQRFETAKRGFETAMKGDSRF